MFQDPPCAVIWAEESVMFFDEDGEQIPELQKQAIDGLEESRERFPEAEVYDGVWADKAVKPLDESEISELCS